MTIALLDPAFFLSRSDDELRRDLDDIIKICRDHSLRLPPIPEYWDYLQLLARPLETVSGPITKRAFMVIRQISAKSNLEFNQQPNVGSYWQKGFKVLFNTSMFPNQPWHRRMATAILRALATGERVVLLVRKINGRNVSMHASPNNGSLEEITRWSLYVRAANAQRPTRIACCHHSRNLSEEWTTRYNWQLPAPSDGGSHPFCVPDQWWMGRHSACSGFQWVDRFNNQWGRPANIPCGKGNHWDVQLCNQYAQLMHRSYLNIIDYPSKVLGKPSGDIHHTPTKQPQTSIYSWKSNCC
ncbi:MAG: hypothetical protein HQL94_02475 [Magnetococcales bacterium]|nr:hypothetical protein [Magnetococcales bacterium]